MQVVFYRETNHKRNNNRGDAILLGFEVLSRFSSQIAQYQSNNRGQVPQGGNLAANTANIAANRTGWSGFVRDYMRASGDTFDDPDGVSYGVTDHGAVANGQTRNMSNANANTNGRNLDHVIHVYRNAHCEGETVAFSSGARNLAYLYQLEGAGVYCGTN